MKEIAHDPALRASGTIVEVDEELRGKYLTVGSPVKFSDFTPHITGAPLLGEQSEQVLTELGYTATQIGDMAAAQIIRTPIMTAPPSPAKPTGWCSWQGLVAVPDVPDNHVAVIIIGAHGNFGPWPVGGSDLQWWFDLPWLCELVEQGVDHGANRADDGIAYLRQDGLSGVVDDVQKQ